MKRFALSVIVACLVSLWLGPLQHARATPQKTTPRGVGVVCLGDSCQPSAARLARVIYRQANLRPSFDEKTAKTLIGHRHAKPDSISEALDAARTSPQSVRKRLLLSLGKQLGVQLLLLVDQPTDAPSRARVVDIQKGRLLGIELRPTPTTTSSPPSWADALVTIQALTQGRAMGPQRADVRQRHPLKPEKATTSVWKSPWFWTGIGVVAAASITVIVLSQTVGKNTDEVAVSGRVAP